MESKRLIYLGMFVGGFIGGYIPVLWGASGFSLASVIGNAIGAIIGIWVMFKISRY